MACITHLKHTIGSVITVDTGTSLLAPERVPDEGIVMGSITRQRDIIDRRELTE